jgi:UDP-glucose 4-epimerase
LTARRSIVSDRNLASAVAHVLEHPRTGAITALVADAQPLTVSEIVAALRKAAGRGPGLVAMPGTMAMTLALLNRRDTWNSLAGRLELAPTRLSETGWRPAEDSGAGLARTMAGARG